MLAHSVSCVHSMKVKVFVSVVCEAILKLISNVAASTKVLQVLGRDGRLAVSLLKLFWFPLATALIICETSHQHKTLKLSLTECSLLSGPTLLFISFLDFVLTTPQSLFNVSFNSVRWFHTSSSSSSSSFERALIIFAKMAQIMIAS